MTKPEELAYWLQGFFEITDAKVLTISQVAKIRAKVESCFEKVTPDYKVRIDPNKETLNEFFSKAAKTSSNGSRKLLSSTPNPLEEISIC